MFYLFISLETVHVVPIYICSENHLKLDVKVEDGEEREGAELMVPQPPSRDRRDR
jgi:hypothetical protein